MACFERQPRFFIAENVKGILSANEGKSISYDNQRI